MSGRLSSNSVSRWSTSVLRCFFTLVSFLVIRVGGPSSSLSLVHNEPIPNHQDYPTLMDPHPTSTLLQSWALEAGFDRAGVACLAPLEHGETLVRWLERGDQAGMEYLERRVEARVDPSQVFPGARSVLCVALQYHPLDRED